MVRHSKKVKKLRDVLSDTQILGLPVDNVLNSNFRNIFKNRFIDYVLCFIENYLLKLE